MKIMYLIYIAIGITFLIGIIKISKKIRKNPIDHKLGKNPTDHAFKRNLEKLLPREPEKVANNEVERKPEKIIVKVNTMSAISRIWNIALDIVTVAVFTFENAEKNQISFEYAESNLAPQTEIIMPELQPEVQAIEPITISVAPQSEIPILEVQPEVQEPDPSTESVALQSEVLVESIELVSDLIPSQL